MFILDGPNTYTKCMSSLLVDYKTVMATSCFNILATFKESKSRY